MTNNYHVVKDPVHGTMQFTSTEHAWIKPFIDSPQFQRLRHVKQMGMGDFIFPGAVHTRFNHSMGCCYVGSQIANKIGLSDQDKQLVMIACLLHDIGHGPFSHAFEGIYAGNIIRHEMWTPLFLSEYKTPEFFYQYNKVNPKFPLDEEKFDQIANMIMHRPVKNRLLADIVSSQLDADRLDYLLRDSHFCGVRYGEFDSRWMLHCLAIVNSPSGQRLGISHKGIGVVEHYLMARRLMIRNIYQLPKKLGFENFLIEMLSSLAESLEHIPAYKAIRHSRLGEFLQAATQFEKNQREAFIAKNFAVYKDLCDYDVFAVIRQLAEICDEHPAALIATRLHRRMMPKIERFDFANLKDVTDKVSEFKHKYKKDFQDWQLMINETPARSYTSGADDTIYVVDESGDINPISNYSIMIDAMSDKLEHAPFLSIDKSIADDKRVTDFVKSLDVARIKARSA